MKNNKIQTNKVHRNVRVEPEIWSEFRRLVEIKGSTVSKTIRQFVDEYIEMNKF